MINYNFSICYILGKLSSHKKLVGDGFWSIVGQLFTAISLILSTRILTELLSPKEFGKLSLCLGISALLVGFFCTPISHAVIRFYPDYLPSGRLGVLRTVGYKLLLKSTLVVFVIIIISGIFYSVFTKKWTNAAVVLSVLTAFEIIRNFELNLLATARRQKEYALWSIADAVGRLLVASICIIYISPTLSSILTGYLIATAVILFGARFLLPLDAVSALPTTSTTINSANDEIRLKIRSYALPLAPLAIVGWVSSLSDRYIIGGLIGLNEVGMYAAVYGLVSRPFLMAGSVIEQALKPIYFKAVSADDHLLGEKILNIWFVSTLMTCLVGVVFIAFYCNEIAWLLLAKSYRESARLMPWIAAGYMILVISYIFEKPAYAHLQTRFVLKIQIFGAVASLFIGVPSVYFFGVTGAAVAVPAYFGIQMITAGLICRRIIHSKSNYIASVRKNI